MSKLKACLAVLLSLVCVTGGAVEVGKNVTVLAPATQMVEFGAEVVEHGSDCVLSFVLPESGPRLKFKEAPVRLATHNVVLKHWLQVSQKCDVLSQANLIARSGESWRPSAKAWALLNSPDDLLTQAQAMLDEVSK